MAANTLSILKPSVNNLTARIFVRAAGLDFEEVDVWGKKDEPEFLAKDPAAPDAAARGGRPAEGLAVGELRDHAVPVQQARARPASTRPTRAERAMVDSAMFYLIGTLYPLVARATYPTLGFPQYAGEVGDLGGRRRDQGAGAAGRRGRARRAARRLPRRSSSTASGSSAATSPSIADIRLAATLEFLRAIDYDFPDWAEEYMAAMEAALGDAYSEPAADVRGFVAGAKSLSTE